MLLLHNLHVSGLSLMPGPGLSLKVVKPASVQLSDVMKPDGLWCISVSAVPWRRQLI